MILVLQAGDGAARRGAIKARRRGHAGGHGDRATLGEAATSGTRGNAVWPGGFFLFEAQSLALDAPYR